jgi:hypothetical protein
MEMKERAELKIMTNLLTSKKELLDAEGYYWSANETQMEQIKESKKNEIELYEYILKLIQDDISGEGKVVVVNPGKNRQELERMKNPIV